MEPTSRFSYLLDRYFQNKATIAENAELSILINSGQYDNELKGKIEAYLCADKGQQDVSEEEAKSVLDNILSGKPGRVIALQERKGSNFKWRWVAAAIVVVASGWFLIGRQENIFNGSGKRHAEHRTKVSFYSGKQFIQLPDGSTVLLNEGSELSYDSTFGSDKRKVFLKGEGYFNVAHDPSRPFIVKARNVITTVLGTAFNVKAYEGENEIKVTVARGKVQVANQTKMLGTITPNQQIAVNTITNSFVQTNLKASIETEWVNRALIFDDINMAQAAEAIEAKFKTKILFAREDLKDCRITAAFLNGESLEQVIKVVSAVVLVEYTIEPDGSVRLYGKGCQKRIKIRTKP